VASLSLVQVLKMLLSTCVTLEQKNITFLLITQDRVVQIQASKSEICNTVTTELFSATGEKSSDLHRVGTIPFGEKKNRSYQKHKFLSLFLSISTGRRILSVPIIKTLKPNLCTNVSIQRTIKKYQFACKRQKINSAPMYF